jgi:hypothetical protein
MHADDTQVEQPIATRTLGSSVRLISRYLDSGGDFDP